MKLSKSIIMGLFVLILMTGSAYAGYDYDNGDIERKETDFTLDLGGFSLSFDRTYHSSANFWTFTYGSSTIVETGENTWVGGINRLGAGVKVFMNEPGTAPNLKQQTVRNNFAEFQNIFDADDSLYSDDENDNFDKNKCGKVMMRFKLLGLPYGGDAPFIAGSTAGRGLPVSFLAHNIDDVRLTFFDYYKVGCNGEQIPLDAAEQRYYLNIRDKSARFIFAFHDPYNAKSYLLGHFAGREMSAPTWLTWDKIEPEACRGADHDQAACEKAYDGRAIAAIAVYDSRHHLRYTFDLSTGKRTIELGHGIGDVVGLQDANSTPLIKLHYTNEAKNVCLPGENEACNYSRNDLFFEAVPVLRFYYDERGRIARVYYPGHRKDGALDLDRHVSYEYYDNDRIIIKKVRKSVDSYKGGNEEHVTEYEYKGRCARDGNTSGVQDLMGRSEGPYKDSLFPVCSASGHVNYTNNEGLLSRVIHHSTGKIDSFVYATIEIPQVSGPALVKQGVVRRDTHLNAGILSGAGYSEETNRLVGMKWYEFSSWSYTDPSSALAMVGPRLRMLSGDGKMMADYKFIATPTGAKIVSSTDALGNETRYEYNRVGCSRYWENGIGQPSTCYPYYSKIKKRIDAANNETIYFYRKYASVDIRRIPGLSKSLDRRLLAGKFVKAPGDDVPLREQDREGYVADPTKWRRIKTIGDYAAPPNGILTPTKMNDNSGYETNMTYDVESPCPQTLALEKRDVAGQYTRSRFQGHAITPDDPMQSCRMLEESTGGQSCSASGGSQCYTHKSYEYSRDPNQSGLFGNKPVKTVMTQNDTITGGDSDSYTVYMEWDRAGRIKSRKYQMGENNPANEGIETTYEYDDLNRRIKEIQGDKTINFINEILPADSTECNIDADLVALVRCPASRITKTDSTGKSMVVEYNGLGDIISEKRNVSENHWETKVYEYSKKTCASCASSQMNIISIVDFDGREKQFKYDDLGRKILERQRMQDRWIDTSYEYDVSGVLSGVIRRGKKTGYEYDVLGNRTSITFYDDASGLEPQLRYEYLKDFGMEAGGVGSEYTNVLQSIDQILVDPDLPKTPLYDAEWKNNLRLKGELIRTKSWLDGLDGNVVSEILSVYDQRNQLIMTDTNAGGELQNWGGLGNDDEDRLFLYDITGKKRTAVARSKGKIIDMTTYEYESVQGLSKVGSGLGDMSYSYGYSGNTKIQTINYPDTPASDSGLNITKTIDNMGHLISITDGSHQTSFVYDDNAHVFTRSIPNGISQTTTYDLLGRITAIDSGSSDQVFDYTYKHATDTEAAAAGYTVVDTHSYQQHTRSAGAVAPAHDTWYDIDGMKRMIKEDRTGLGAGGAGTRSNTYQYDDSGNRLQWSNSENGQSATHIYGGSDGVSSVSEYDGLGRMQVVDSRKQLFDGRGNLYFKSEGESCYIYSYNLLNRLEEVKVLDNCTGHPGYDPQNPDPVYLISAVGITKTAHFTYDAFDRRVERRIETNGTFESTFFMYFPSGEIAQEMTGVCSAGNCVPGEAKKRYVWRSKFNPERVYTKQDNNWVVYYYITDRLKTPNQLVDSSGTIVWEGVQDPYGEMEETVATVEQNLRFPGQYDDRGGWGWYNWHRWYSPKEGYYQKVDPIYYLKYLKVSSVKGMTAATSLYRYGNTNAISFIDYLGLETCEEAERRHSECVDACGDMLSRCFDGAREVGNTCKSACYEQCEGHENEAMCRNGCYYACSVAEGAAISVCMAGYGMCLVYCSWPSGDESCTEC